MEQRQISAELSFDGTADEIWAQLKKDDADTTRTVARNFADARVSFSLGADKPLDSLSEKEWEKAAVSFGLALGPGKDLIEARAVGDSLYVRGDIKGLIEKTGADTQRDDLALLDQMTDAVDELPDALGSIKDALHGKWIEFDPKDFEEFSAEQFTEEGDNSLFPGAVLGEFSAKDKQKALEAIGKALGKNVDIKADGEKNGVERFTLTLPARDTAADLLKGLKPLEDKLGLSEVNAKDFADRDVRITIAVKDGMVNKLSFDPGRLDPNSEAALPVTLSLKAGGSPVKAPTDAKKLNPQDIFGAFAYTAMQNGEWQNAR